MIIEGAEIASILPHRYPFLLVDRVLEMESGKRITAIKNVTYNEPFFAGHFPGNPIMPGVLIIEAMAQAGGILAIRSSKNPEAMRQVFFTGIEKARFRRPVIPGDQLRIVLEVIGQREPFWKMRAEAFVGTQKIAEAVLSAMVGKRVAEPQEEP